MGNGMIAGCFYFCYLDMGRWVVLLCSTFAAEGIRDIARCKHI